MHVFRNVAGSVAKAVDFVVDKNRRAALINRLKIVVRNEKEVEARAYIELGRYYFENLRDPENTRTEPLCVSVENADRRLKRAFAKLDEMLMPSGAGEEEACADSGREDGGEERDDDREDEDFFRTFSAAAPEGEAAEDGPVE